MQDPSWVCDLHHSSCQHWTLNPLSEARDGTHNCMVLVGFVSAALGQELLECVSYVDIRKNECGFCCFSQEENHSGARISACFLGSTGSRSETYLWVFFFSSSSFLLLHLWHMEDPRLGVKLELQLPAYATATPTHDPSRVCDPHRSQWQSRILNPLREARDQTGNLTVPSRIHFTCSMMGTPDVSLYVFPSCLSSVFPSREPCRSNGIFLPNKVI